MSGLRGTQYWGRRKARWYSEALRYSDYPDKILRVMEPVVRECSSLLDIGAGCGALCIPLADVFDRVVALDASEAMLEALCERAGSAGVSNIWAEAATWDEAKRRLGTFDVVLCANVVNLLNDPATSIAHLEQHVKRYLFLVVGTPKNSDKFHFRELWPLIYGKSFPEKEDYFAIYSYLYRMHIFANVVMVSYDFDQPFKDLGEAVLFWKEHMGLDGNEWDETLREFLSKKLERSGGRLWARVPKQSAVIWWQPMCQGEQPKAGSKLADLSRFEERT
ncbi:MAG: methyltransferase domain-containing protein [Candidatus Hydrogenedentota bacterium]|nr:MAG: methyltransferase domain-containing protein [Candidatus Hydrogenedentota bacterium]